MVGFIPVAAQILSRPFLYRSHDGVDAIAAVTIFAAGVLSITITIRRLKGYAPSVFLRESLRLISKEG
jgi:hypothetical protein